MWWENPIVGTVHAFPFFSLLYGGMAIVVCLIHVIVWEYIYVKTVCHRTPTLSDYLKSPQVWVIVLATPFVVNGIIHVITTS